MYNQYCNHHQILYHLHFYNFKLQQSLGKLKNIISKGKAGTRRSSTKTCEGYLVFSITSTESHTGLNKNEKKIMEF